MTRTLEKLTFVRDVAEASAKLSTCSTRSAVGAVLYDDSFRIIATGYNGVPQGQPHCNTVGCVMENGSCIAAVHAEVNAILQCAFYGISTAGLNLLSTHSPCNRCAVMIVRAGIKSVIYLYNYKASTRAAVLFHDAGINYVAWR